MKYTPNQYRNLSNKKKRQLRLGSKDIDSFDISSWKSNQEYKKSMSSVYKRYSGGYR